MTRTSDIFRRGRSPPLPPAPCTTKLVASVGTVNHASVETSVGPWAASTGSGVVPATLWAALAALVGVALLALGMVRRRRAE